MHHAHSRKPRRFASYVAFAAGGALAASAVVSGCSGKVTGDDTGGLNGGTTSTAGSGNSSAARSGGSSISLGGSSNGGSGAASGHGGTGTGVVVVGASGAAGESEAGSGGGAGVPSIDPNEACADSSATVEALPSVLQLVVDTSGSMDWPPGWEPQNPDDSKPPGATKWEITRDALNSALDSLADDVAVGLSFFPNVTPLTNEFVCLDNEVAVPITVLGSASSSARKAFKTALDGVDPLGGTPTEGGYLYGLEQLAGTKLTGSKFVLLITDGTPTCTLDCECNDGNVPVDSKPLVDDAAQALDDGVRTFVIGSPGSENTRDVLSELATEGGTAKPNCSDQGPVYCHFDMTTEPDLSAALRTALETVAASLRSCEYAVPEPSGSKMVDPNLVNVLLTPSKGKTETIPRDPSASDCREGWQYTKDKTSIVLCGDACEKAKSDVGAQVEIVLGCKTVSGEVR
jgi:Mg-chelatase subunit ChlD